jgi:hypothetical protein
MCHKCAELQRRVEQLESANKVLRGLNMRLNSKLMLSMVENNNLRNVVNVPMRPVSGAGYLVDWEQKQEGVKHELS